MKSSPLLVFFTSWAMLAPFGYARSLPAPSRITAVTVYPDRALITRSAKTELPAGESEILLEQLPVNLLDESLQVAGSGATGITILDVTSRPQFISTTPDLRIKNLEEELNVETKKLRTLTDRVAIIEQQRGLIGRIENAVASAPSKEGPAARPVFEDWQKLVTFTEENRNRYAAELQALDLQRQDQQAKIDALRNQLNELRGHAENGRGYKTVAIHLSAVQAATLDLNVSYTVQGASWAPSYDARLRSEDHTVDLTYFGVVRQNSGEDWRDVALTLSTARPSLGGGAPELPGWIVDVARPVPMETVSLSSFSVRAKSPRRAAAPAADMAGGVSSDNEAKESLPPAVLATATVDQAATSASFKIEAPATVLSDNTPQKVGVTTAKLAAALEYRAAPRLAETAFLNAEVTNTTDFPLLAGMLNTFLGESYVASGTLKTVMPTEKFSLSLGADEGLSIKRKLVNRFAEDTGLTNSGRRVTYDYLVTLANHKRSAEHMVFRESVPVSRNEKIVVNQLVPSDRELGTPEKPKEVTREPEGKLVWRVDLKPGEKREFRLKFNVEYPANTPVSGLE